MSRGFRVWDVEADEYLPNSVGSCDGVLGISADGKKSHRHLVYEVIGNIHENKELLGGKE